MNLMRRSQSILHLLKETLRSVSMRQQGAARGQAGMILLTILSFGKLPVKKYASFEWREIYHFEIEI